ncbi:MAG: phenylalanine--tRNA ligase subunit beta [Chloroflexi bacterium]|nr:phenylalanine--tRNA ligase subunit beta [Chloroflexota bacterium]
MKAPVSWLKEYVDINEPLHEVAHRLTMAGTEVGSIDQIGAEWGPVVVGHVQAVNPHPDADRLRLVTVEYGGEDGPAEVVCGAPNVAVGQNIAYAGIGAMLNDPYRGGATKLKRSKIRGVVSNGMVCSEKELGISDEHEGILVLPDDASVGTPLMDYLGDAIFDLELTPNRPDCLGVLGVARELAAIGGTAIREPDISYPEDGPPVDSLATIRIDDPDLCARYTATVLQNLTLGPSPEWLVKRLAAQGQASISNVVDVTNYVMFEYGQPLHAFDLDAVENHAIVVRRSYAGEQLTTLDGVQRELAPDTLVIADPEKSIGLAGVMGGANSEISDSTVNVLLESATFNGTNNRITARKLGMKTEATLRFEKGLRPGLSEVALRRATKLILEVAGGTAAQGILDAYPEKDDAVVTLTDEKLLKVMGVEYPEMQVIATLEGLGMEVERVGSSYEVRPPYWRPDIAIPEDVCEEISRIVGYDEVPMTTLSGRVPTWEPSLERDLREKVRASLANHGLQEIISYPTESDSAMTAVGAPTEYSPLRLENPMAQDQPYMRTTIRASVFRAAARNARTWRGAIALFEVGAAYLYSGEGLPEERQMVVGAFNGPRDNDSWVSDTGASDFYDAKGAVEAVLEDLGIEGGFEVTDDPAFAPGRCAAITVNGKSVGVVGEATRAVLEAVDCDRTPLAAFEIDLSALGEAIGESNAPRAYQPFTRYPSSVRDLALLVDTGVSAGAIRDVIAKNRLSQQIDVVDVYSGKGVPVGKKSLAVRVHYQSDTKTLTAKEIEKAEAAILKILGQELGAELRS